MRGGGWYLDQMRGGGGIWTKWVVFGPNGWYLNKFSFSATIVSGSGIDMGSFDMGSFENHLE